MSFENASVTKGIMMFLAVTSTVAGIFDLKHNLHLQLVPHLSKHHQYWRLLVHHLACATSSDLLLTELVLYNAAINVERGFGSVKYFSFVLIVLGLNTIGTMLALLVLQQIPGLGQLANSIPAGPTAIILSILYQYFRLVPEAYHFRIFGVTFSDKFWVYGIAFQLALGHTPSTLVSAIVGWTAGSLYRSDIIQLKGWRVPHSVVLFGQHWILPILGQERPSRRTTRVMPEPMRPLFENEEPVTTARRPPRVRNNSRPQSLPEGPEEPQEQPVQNEAHNADTRGVVRQWVSELTEAANPSSRGNVRVPSDSEVQMVTSMFPDIGRDVVLGALQRRYHIFHPLIEHKCPNTFMLAPTPEQQSRLCLAPRERKLDSDVNNCMALLRQQALDMNASLEGVLLSRAVKSLVRHASQEAKSIPSL